MERAKEQVKEFLHDNNKHSVEIEQTTAPVVVHEKVQEARHEHVTEAYDREIHQHHHQIHVQPIQDKVVEPEKHHHNVLAAVHKEKHHGRDREIEVALREQQSQFRDEREVLPMQQSQSHNVVVGEHVHHHIHDTIQPVIEREVIQQHVVHTTVPIHETIHKEPIIHTGNVLPAVTMEEFKRQNIPLTGGHTKKEHIEYQGEPLKILPDSRVGFDHTGRHIGAGSTGAPGELGTNAGHTGTAGIIGGSGITTGLAGTHLSGTHGHHTHGTHTHGHHHGVGTTGAVAGTALAAERHHRKKDRVGRNRTGSSSSSSSSDGEYSTTRRNKTTAGPHNSNIANKLDPRVDSDLDRSRTVGHTGTTGGLTGTGLTGTGLTGAHGLAGTHGTTGTGLTGTRGDNYTGTTGTGLTGTHGTGLTGTGLTGTRGDNYTGTQGTGLTGTHGTGLTGTRGDNYTSTTTTGPGGTMNYDNKTPRTAGTGLTGRDNVTEEVVTKQPSTTDKILHSVGLK